MKQVIRTLLSAFKFVLLFSSLYEFRFKIYRNFMLGLSVLIV